MGYARGLSVLTIHNNFLLSILACYHSAYCLNAHYTTLTVPACYLPRSLPFSLPATFYLQHSAKKGSTIYSTAVEPPKFLLCILCVFLVFCIGYIKIILCISTYFPIGFTSISYDIHFLYHGLIMCDVSIIPFGNVWVNLLFIGICV